MSSALPRALADRWTNASPTRASSTPATTLQRLRAQVWMAIRHELPLSFHLVLFAVSVLPWIFRLNDGWVLWVALERDLATSAFVSSIVASVVAFTFGQRDARNPIIELQAGTVSSRRGVVLARIAGMLLASWGYLAVLVGGTYLLGVLHADWGRPDIRPMAPLVLWLLFVVPLLVALGDLSIQLEPIRLLVVLIIAGIAIWFGHLFAWFPFVVSIMEGLPWPDPPPHTVVTDIHRSLLQSASAWPWILAGFGALLLTALALPGRFGTNRRLTRTSIVVAVLAFVTVAAAAVGTGSRIGSGYVSRSVTGELSSCLSGPMWEACSHPAYAGMVERHRADITVVLSVVEEVDIPPLHIDFMSFDMLPDQREIMPDPAVHKRVVVHVQDYVPRSGKNFQIELVRQMFTVEGASVHDSTVANVVRAWWLLELGFTPDDTLQLANWMGRHDDYPTGYTPPDLSPHIDRFASLPAVQRNTWLEANWAGLRSGDLTLEDLP